MGQPPKRCVTHAKGKYAKYASEHRLENNKRKKLAKIQKLEQKENLKRS